MTLTEAIAQVEAAFTVHEDVGRATSYEDQNGKVVGAGPRDRTLAPNGEPYLTITSHGVNAELPGDVFVLFTKEGLATQWWVDEVFEFARTLESNKDLWKKLNLYWRVKPIFHSTTFLAMDQGSLLRTASPLAALLTIDLGFTWSEMLISKTGPDGKET